MHNKNIVKFLKEFLLIINENQKDYETLIKNCELHLSYIKNKSNLEKRIIHDIVNKIFVIKLTKEMQEDTKNSIEDLKNFLTLYIYFINNDHSISIDFLFTLMFDKNITILSNTKDMPVIYIIFLLLLLLHNFNCFSIEISSKTMVVNELNLNYIINNNILFDYFMENNFNSINLVNLNNSFLVHINE